MNYITLYLAEIPKHQPDNEEGFHGKDGSTLLLVYLYVNQGFFETSYRCMVQCEVYRMHI